MDKFNDILKELKKLNQARRFNNVLNGKGINDALADANSLIIRAKLAELKEAKKDVFMGK